VAGAAVNVAAPTELARTAPETRLTDLRVLIVHEWFVTWAGSERVVEQLAEIVPQADVVVGVAAPAMRATNALASRAIETWVARLPWARTRHRWFVPLHPLSFAAVDTRGYDLVISSSHAFAKSVRVQPGTPHVCYCHSPPRYLYDLGDTYAAHASLLERVALRAMTPVLRRADRRGAAGVTQFVCNSHFVADRVRRCYGRASDVVPPPVVRKAPTPVESLSRGEFLLSLGRLVAYKRVDLAISAAERLGVPLVIAGDGPDRARLERLAGQWTTFVGEVTDETAAELLERCASFVFCAEEDFGIAPVEANAHGAPVIGYGRGGLLESMVPGETAELFAEQSVEAVVTAVRRALSRRWNDATLRANAERFSPDHFRRGMTQTIARALDDARGGGA
jgi:glycosyltransferase involved in cell wall biosynthesis